MFGLCQIHAFIDYVRSKLNKEQFQLLFRTMVMLATGAVTAVGAILTATGSILYLQC